MKVEMKSKNAATQYVGWVIKQKTKTKTKKTKKRINITHSIEKLCVKDLKRIKNKRDYKPPLRATKC
jgi:hypothetical protein